MTETTKEIELNGGTWRVTIFSGGACFISDGDGERVHASYKHQSTAVHLAMALSKIRELNDQLRNTHE